MKVAGVAGHSGMGKTTLLERLVPELTARGLVVSLIQHSHEAIQTEEPGKDSFAPAARRPGADRGLQGRRLSQAGGLARRGRQSPARQQCQPPKAPIAPAFANAVARLTGNVPRELPFPDKLA